MIDEKALFKFTFLIMLSIGVAEKSVTLVRLLHCQGGARTLNLVDLFIVDKKECEKTQFMKSAVGECVSCFSKSMLKSPER